MFYATKCNIRGCYNRGPLYQIFMGHRLSYTFSVISWGKMKFLPERNCNRTTLSGSVNWLSFCSLLETASLILLVILGPPVVPKSVKSMNPWAVLRTDRRIISKSQPNRTPNRPDIVCYYKADFAIISFAYYGQCILQKWLLFCHFLKFCLCYRNIPTTE